MITENLSLDKSDTIVGTIQVCQNYTKDGMQPRHLVDETISNATMEFVKLVVPDGDMQNLARKTVTPEILLNISRQFEPIVVGEEFLHFVNQTMPQLELLGNKLALKEAIKIVWLGGSNTHGRSNNPFVKQISDMVNAEYPSSLGQRQHEFVNKGRGGGTCCTFARGFKNDFVGSSVKGADLVFLEFANNDGVLNLKERLSCFESLILRIRAVSPNATLVALCLSQMEGHDTVIEHYNLLQIHLGNIFERVPAIHQDAIHLNDIGSFLVRQAVSGLLKEATRLYCFSTGGGGRSTAVTVKNFYILPPRLFEPAENFDWILPFNNGGEGWAIHNTIDLQAACAPALESASDKTNSTGSLLGDDAGNCSAAILARTRTSNSTDKGKGEIPCDECPDTKFPEVEEVGGGWTWCGTPWPVICKPNGVHHHHCSDNNSTGIFMQTFGVDNRATDDWPDHRSREMALTMRLLKGYDADFGQALVVAWVHEANTDKMAAKPVVTLIDTKWETRATVLADVRITPLFNIPSPKEHETITLKVLVLPHNPLSSNTTSATSCRLYFHSVLAELV